MSLPVTQALGSMLRSRRRRIGLTIRALAERVGATQAEVLLWERGEGVPDEEVIIALAATLGLMSDDLECAANAAREKWSSTPQL